MTTDFSRKKNTKIIGSLPLHEPSADDNPEPPTSPAGGQLRILALTVDRDQNEDIERVPQWLRRPRVPGGAAQVSAAHALANGHLPRL